MLRDLLIICSIATFSSNTGPGFAQIARSSLDSPQQGVAKDTGVRDLGIKLYRHKRFGDANEVLKKAVKDRKSDHQAWYYLGLVQIQLKDFKKAVKNFEIALGLQPQFDLAHLGLSYAQLRRNRLKEAVLASEHALRINPNIPDAHYIIGVVKLMENNKEEALERAESVIRLNPELPTAYLLKSQALLSLAYDALVPEDDESTNLRLSRCRSAKEALEEYLRLEPNAPDKETWIEQLAGLNIYGLSPNEMPDDLRPRRKTEVTTKVRVLRQPEPRYTDKARSNLVTGTVVLAALFAADGSVKYLIILRGLPDGLTEASIQAAKKIRFTPATIGGLPVSMLMQVEYNFSLH